MKKILLMLAVAVSAMVMQAETFIKVTDVASLHDGDKVVMGYATAGKVSAGFSDTKKFLDATDATFDGNNVSLSNPTVITLRQHGSYWNLYIGNNVIGHTSGSNELDTKYRYTTDFAISFEANGNVNIISQTPGKNNNQVFFAYNPNSPRFAIYMASSNMQPITLYKLDESTIAVSSVTLNQTEAEMRVEDILNLQATVLPANAVDQTLAWGSTDEAVATVTNGVVTAVGVGSAKIWVKATAVANVSDTCFVTVLPKAAEGNVTYNAVRSAAHMPEGAKVIIGTAKDGENYVMGQYVSGNNIKGTAATYGDGRHSVTAPLQVAYTVHIENGQYMLVDHDGYYLRTMSSSKLGSGDNDAYAKWTLGTFNATDATVVLTASNGKGIYNNWQGTNDLFNIYDGVGDGSYLAYTIIYSNQAPAWTNPDPVHVTGVQLDNTLLTLEVGESSTLVATVLPANTDFPTVTWTSSNTGVATVVNGVVTAVAAGTAVITAAADGQSATCDVTVNAPAAPDGDYVLVESNSQLAAGDIIVFANSSAGKVASTFNSTYLEVIDATISQNALDCDNPMEFTLGKNGNYWTFTNGSDLLGGSEKTLVLNAETTQWTIDITGGVATVKPKDSIYPLQYNSGSPRFKLYNEGSQGDCEIYKKKNSSTVDIQTAESEGTNAQKILRDGRLYIIRGEHMYDATGAMVR